MRKWLRAACRPFMSSENEWKILWIQHNNGVSFRRLLLFDESCLHRFNKPSVAFKINSRKYMHYAYSIHDIINAFTGKEKKKPGRQDCCDITVVFSDDFVSLRALTLLFTQEHKNRESVCHRAINYIQIFSIVNRNIISDIIWCCRFSSFPFVLAYVRLHREN